MENLTTKETIHEGDPISNKGALVYVVDDDWSAREGVARLIRSAGLLTKTFSSGEEFLAARRRKVPGCLVPDVNLPGVNGLDLQDELRKSGSQLPIVFNTGHGDIPMAVSAVRAGAANFLTKPFDDGGRNPIRSERGKYGRGKPETPGRFESYPSGGAD